MNKQFKLIAIRPLEGCASNIRKVLKENTTYFLYNNYEIDSKNENMVKLKDGLNFQDNFYNPLNKKSPFINISAIVGKNGDGKSSIIEMIMRVLNNFAYAYGFLKDQKELQPVKGLHAIFHYSIGEEIYYIKSEEKEIEASFLSEKLNIDTPLDNLSIDKLKSHFFYSQISNYSLYSYNSKELKHENLLEGNCWIDGIFHKNDAYQTPIVLNPWRSEGNINVNKENYLSTQRLISLFVTDDDKEKGIRNINDNQYAKYLIYHTFDKTKLAIKTYDDFFGNAIRYDNKLFDTEIKDIQADAKFANNYEYLEGSHLKSLKELQTIVEENKSDFIFALNIAKKSNNIETEEENRLIPDFETYLIELNKTLEKYSEKGVDTKEALSIISFFETNQFSQFSLQQIQRVVLVVAIRHLWNNNLAGQYKSEDVYSDDIISKAKQYIIYKTISVFEKYPQYRDIEKVSAYNQFNSIFGYSSNLNDHINEQKKCFNKLITDIDEENSHVSLKLRQTLNFVQNSSKYIRQELINKKIVKSVNKTSNPFPEESFLIDFDEFNKELDKINSKPTIELLPPPIFNIDVILQQKSEDSELSMLSNLSSGERQLLNSVSSVIYHLKNLNSVKDSQLVKYKHINLIFEEIELYFHPDFQRQYINTLIRYIKKANLDKIESLNMCFVTHSPFILSDIPLSNILSLKDGEPFQEDKETFGANIHDLLANSFFLENGFMGEFAKEKITSVINFMESIIQNKVYENEDTWDKKQFDRLYTR